MEQALTIAASILLVLLFAGSLATFAYAVYTMRAGKATGTAFTRRQVVRVPSYFTIGLIVLAILLKALGVPDVTSQSSGVFALYLDIIAVLLLHTLILARSEGGTGTEDSHLVYEAMLYCAIAFSIIEGCCSAGMFLLPGSILLFLMGLIAYILSAFIWIGFIMYASAILKTGRRYAKTYVFAMAGACLVYIAMGMGESVVSFFMGTSIAWVRIVSLASYVALVALYLVFVLLISKGSRLEKMTFAMVPLCPLASAIVWEFVGGTYFDSIAFAVALTFVHVAIAARQTERVRVHMDSVKLASTIQQAMLPHEFPQDGRMDVYAKMEPAKEVAGDFYDVYMPNDYTLYMLVADVSGKGVPASLFMARTKGLMREYMKMGFAPHQIFNHVNEALCEGNDTMTFVTAWLARLDLRQGLMVFANAGHNPPIVGQGGEVSYLRTRPQLTLGARDHIKYRRQSIRLSAGDRLMLYTDGITEAERENGEQFGEDRLIEYARRCAGGGCKSTVEGVFEAVDAFTGTQERFDDVTMVCMTYKGWAQAANMRFAEEVFPAEHGRAGDVIAFIEGACRPAGMPAGDFAKVSGASGEIFSGIADYAYDGPGDVVISVACLPDQVIVRLTDEGKPFNPLSVSSHVRELTDDDPDTRGRAIRVVQEIVDDVFWENVCGENRFTFVKLLKRDGAAQKDD